MKKILHLTQTDIRSDSRILKEISAAENSGYEVIGIGIISDDETVISSSNASSETIKSIVLLSSKLIFLPKTLRHILTFFEFLIKSFFLSVKSMPDIIHCNDTLVLPVGALVKIFTRSKLVYDAHELESNRNGLSRFLGKVTLLIERALWRFVDGLIVVSPSIECWYKSHVGNKLSAIILNSPVIENKNVFSSDDYLREYFGIQNGKKIFIYVGILSEGRGINLILDAFENSRIESCLVFLGYGDLSKKLKEKAKKCENIYVHDAVSHEKVVSVAKSADVGLCLIQDVSLSDYYCLPNKLFEYCFSGIPVLASNFPDISNVVNKYKLGVCVDLNVDDITEGIKRFENDDLDVDFCVSDLVELGWDSQARKLMKLYDKVLSH